ncbi:hypothetical protein PR048_025743 [Dryococelus australis]|uniref:Uncharacterized protein n=1 Tax=Dryococelus australis TaxID=614101 RepID=A0ABQ9GJD6_9NEOP|nr:hypothetical protein PR048_025743 [Dryococelus australis]
MQFLLPLCSAAASSFHLTFSGTQYLCQNLSALSPNVCHVFTCKFKLLFSHRIKPKNTVMSSICLVSDSPEEDNVADEGPDLGLVAGIRTAYTVPTTGTELDSRDLDTTLSLEELMAQMKSI